MKKLLTISAFLGIFAGFMLGSVKIVTAQSTLSEGTSTNICQRKVVQLLPEKQWQECNQTDKDDKTIVCKLMFCNDKSFGGSRPKWNYENCNKYCVTFQEELPIGKDKVKSISANSGTELVLNYVSMIYKFGAALLGIIAVLIIVVSGVQLMVGGIDDASVSAAKDRILQAILSLVLLFSSALILKTINPGFFS